MLAIIEENAQRLILLLLLQIFKVVPHGLRKNAVNAMLECDCTRDQVAAITGQSDKVISHYAKRVNQGKLAKAAIYKLERKNNA